MRLRLGERIQGRRYRRTHGPASLTPEIMAKLREASVNINETLSAMQAEMGVHWVAGPPVRGIRRVQR